MDSNLNHYLKKVLNTVLYVNPVLGATQILAIFLKQFDVLIAIVIVSSTTVAAIVIVSGYLFKKTLDEYFAGSFITNVQRNVQVICVCYILRMIYDFFKLLMNNEFFAWRTRQSEDNEWGYPVFFFFLMITVEFLPILMFTSNFKYIFKNQMAITPKSPKIPKLSNGL